MIWANFVLSTSTRKDSSSLVGSPFLLDIQGLIYSQKQREGHCHIPLSFAVFHPMKIRAMTALSFIVMPFTNFARGSGKLMTHHFEKSTEGMVEKSLEEWKAEFEKAGIKLHPTKLKAISDSSDFCNEIWLPLWGSDQLCLIADFMDSGKIFDLTLEQVRF